MSESLASQHSPRTRPDWQLIGLLLALVLPLRVWLICNTEVTARDSIGYIRYALQFEQYPWTEVLQKNHQHPGYPLLVWLTSVPIRAIEGATTPDNMELAAQLVSFVASLVLLVPMYWLGRQFFARPACFLATLLYQYLPVSAQHLSDGISEPVYLVFLVSGLLHLAHAIRDRRPWLCAWCGIFAGLAYLVRPEGSLILPAFGVMLIATQIRSTWRSPWRRFFACGSAAALAAIAVGCTYVIVIGGLTNKPAAKVTLLLEERAVMSAPAAAPQLFAATFQPTDNKLEQLRRSVLALIVELNQGFHYLAGVPAVLGFWWSFSCLRRQPAFWALFAYGAIHGLILIALAMRAFYISDRHVMILVLIGSFFTATAMCELPRRLLDWLKPTGDSPRASTGPTVWLCSAPLWSAVIFLGLLAVCFPKATQRLHGNRAGNHHAGLWLHEHVKPGDVVEDDHAWSMFHAGLVFLEGREPILPRELEATCYIVVTRSRDLFAGGKGLVVGVIHDKDGNATGLRNVPIAQDAETVYSWPEQAGPDKARVLIYAQRRDPKIHPWRVAP